MHTEHKMKKNTAFATAAASLTAFAALFFTGCDSANDYDIEVSPVWSEVTAVGQQVVLTARGWGDYNWSLSNNEIGYLSENHSGSVVYTAVKIPAPTVNASGASSANEITQVITVKCRNFPADGAVSGGGGPSTTNSVNTSSAVYTGTARVRHTGRAR